ncbi:putative protein NRT1/ PTR FAMILY 6.3 [Iris pallida]|uniref:Uncharacterized protein n=1 Tax=Iris pallida TaxID=29817 RepID=A0AAX6FYU1_IRIPA|nr:putative protein NRT1/ PTR FAMILY 6.3 [Iris pallida]
MDGGEASNQNKWQLSTLTDVEEVKLVIRMLPVWATTIMFWTIYAQMTTFSVSQATAMDRRIGRSFQIPAGSLTVFFVGSILLTVPFYDRVVVPVSAASRATPTASPLSSVSASVLSSPSAPWSPPPYRAPSPPLGVIGRPTHDRVLACAAVLLVGSGEAFTYIGQLDFS